MPYGIRLEIKIEGVEKETAILATNRWTGKKSDACFENEFLTYTFFFGYFCFFSE